MSRHTTLRIYKKNIALRLHTYPLMYYYISYFALLHLKSTK